MVSKDEMITKIRAAIKDRATWFALLYEEFLQGNAGGEGHRTESKGHYPIRLS